MSKLLDTKEFLDTVCQLLEQGERNVPVPVTGSSMIPFLHNGDMVYLNLPGDKLNRGDIVLYRRESGQYVLHRVCRVTESGVWLVGDAQQEIEYLPNRQWVLGKVTAVRHGGKLVTPKTLRWQFYKRVWLLLRPVRHKLFAIREKMKK